MTSGTDQHDALGQGSGGDYPEASARLLRASSLGEDSGESLRPVGNIAALVTEAPSLKLQAASRSKVPLRATLVIELPTLKTSCVDSNGNAQANRYKDSRVFRNRQLVAYQDGTLSGQKVVFNDIALPRDGKKEVEFSAYAFLIGDGVKNQDDLLDFESQKPRPKRPGRSVVVSIGVNTFDHPAGTSNCHGQRCQVV